MPTDLGTLEPIDLRTIRPDEARDVTPWLAQEDNLRRLSEALNLCKRAMSFSDGTTTTRKAIRDDQD